MRRMLNLIQNENMKIFRHVSTYIMLGLLIIIVIATAGLQTKLSPQPASTTDWKTQLTQQNTELQKSITQVQTQGVAVEQSLATFEKIIKTNNYRIEHNLPPDQGKALWGFVTQFVMPPLVKTRF